MSEKNMTRKPWKIDRTLWPEIHRRCEAGENRYKLACEYGCSESTIYSIWKRIKAQVTHGLSTTSAIC